MKSKDCDFFKDSYPIEYLLDSFSKPEILDNENAWHCNKCKKHVRATKTISLYKIPKYLIIHLKKLKLNT